MSVVKTLRSDLKEAMKAGDEARKSALRMVLTEIQYAQVAGTGQEELSDAEALKVVERYHKNLVKAMAEYPDGERKEALKVEIGIIAPYLPQKAGEAETKAAITKVMAASEQKQFGVLMKAVLAELGDSADGKLVSTLLKQMLGN